MRPLRFSFCLSALLLGSCASTQVRGEGGEPGERSGLDAPPAQIHRSAILVGQRQLDEEAWQPLEDQALVGIEFSSVNASTGLGFEMGLLGSFDDDGEGNEPQIELLALEFFGGFRVQAARGRVRPFVGAGAAATYVDVEADLGFASGSDNAIALGGYMHGGINFEVSRDLDLVFEVRQRIGQDIDFSGVELDLDYLTFAVGLSF